MANATTLVYKHGDWIHTAPSQQPDPPAPTTWWRELVRGIRKVATDAPAPGAPLPWFVPNLNRMHAARDRERVHRAIPTYDSLRAEGARHALRYVPPRVLMAAYHHERRTANRALVLKAISVRLRELD